MVFLGDKKELTVVFLDVGQGDSIFIETVDGSQILIDAGRDKKVLRQLTKFMPFYDRSIDIVIATHPDEDHIGGMPDILKRYNVSLFIEPGVTHDTGTYESVRALIEKKEIKTIIADRDLSVVLGGNTLLAFLFPITDASEFASNTASIITQLIYGEHEFLLTGDSPKSIEKYLVNEYGTELESDVLKVGHHGSKTSSDVGFVKTVAPVYAVVSAGKDNRYGHPHIDVLEIFRNESIEIFSTAEEGNIVFKSDGINLIKK